MSKSEPIIGALFFVPFALGPLFVSLVIAATAPSRGCQIILAAGSVIYAAWFAFIFLDAFYWHVDPQSAIALVFIGIYSLPVMIPIWLSALVLRRRNKLKTNQAFGSGPESGH
jgi:hypothetical protein